MVVGGWGVVVEKEEYRIWERSSVFFDVFLETFLVVLSIRSVCCLPLRELLPFSSLSLSLLSSLSLSLALSLSLSLSLRISLYHPLRLSPLTWSHLLSSLNYDLLSYSPPHTLLSGGGNDKKKQKTKNKKTKKNRKNLDPPSEQSKQLRRGFRGESKSTNFWKSQLNNTTFTQFTIPENTKHSASPRVSEASIRIITKPSSPMERERCALRC